MLNQIVIKGTNLPDVWHQTLYEAVRVGRDFTVDTGSNEGQKRKEFDFITIHATCPGTGELLPKLNPALNLDDPCSQDFMDQYLPYLMTGEEKEGEAYTYGQRICAADAEEVLGSLEMSLLIKAAKKDFLPTNVLWLDEEEGYWKLNQMELMIWTYKQLDAEGNHKYRNNQMIMQIGSTADMLILDPPCLRHIDTRIQNNVERELINVKQLFSDLTGKFLPVETSLEASKERVSKVLGEGDAYSQKGINEFLKKCEVPELHFFPYFRSWDLWGGMPANLGAIELMKQYCSKEIGVENGEIIATSKGLHLYNYVWEIAETVRGRTSEEFKNEMSG